jgi:hypothetical protein
MKKIFGSSWRTSLIGYATAAGTVIIPIIQNDGFDIQKQWKSLLIAVVVALWGRVQKDSDGITKQESVIVAKEATDGAIPPEK